MTDNRIDKIRAEIERVKKNQEGVFTSYTDGKFDLCEHLLSFIDSMQEEPKECMYSKDNYTDEDRKALCDGCEEKCKYDKSDDFTKALAECIHNAQCNVIDPMVFAEIWKDELIKLSKCEEPVSEDLEEAANNAVIALVPSFGQKYSDGSYVSSCKDSFKREELLELFKAGANWQEQKDESYTKSMYKVGINTGKELMKQQLIAKAVKVNISNASIVSLPVNCDLKVGDKVLIIKED